ncbi:haloacid dehalogenase type II [Cryobacterium melibiosiphilum]|uniref:Haloacid dehalogenase type II n=1 Tax=Cryobacterium melibiosiphilum TaxID=995039 RepID=A0A3A5MFQ0_9MICO|nr:haloacid dehalogenase type II [Cryobacterium melibiosiphilum]RJT87945.1 haloacid dehalogenase type II [Cryobacterium melibiosiphilum]
MLTRPRVILFDVNETLSDMAPLADRFTAVGAPAHLAALWFSGVLRDGFALTAAGSPASFGEIATDSLRRQFSELPSRRGADEAVAHVMTGFGALELHPDVAAGLASLAEAGLRLATLSNGAARVAETLLGAAGVRDAFERVLSVDDAPAWKPAPGAYEYAVGTLAVAPSDVMLVAVHPWDIHGAARAGLQTAWLNRAGSAYPGYFAQPTVSIRSLTDLVGSLPA